MTATRLWKAHDRIRYPERWTQSQLANRWASNKPLERCLVGAIFNVNAKTSERYGDWTETWTANFQRRVNLDPDCILLTEVVQEMFPDGGWCAFSDPWEVLTMFNDDVERRHEDVLAVMHKAAIRCDEVLGS